MLVLQSQVLLHQGQGCRLLLPPRPRLRLALPLQLLLLVSEVIYLLVRVPELGLDGIALQQHALNLLPAPVYTYISYTHTNSNSKYQRT